MIRATILGLTFVFMAGCQSLPSASSASMQINRGMSYQQALRIASAYPIERTFKGRGTALQFCSGSPGSDAKYVVVWFVDNVVEGLTQYENSSGGWHPNCDTRFREVDWGQAPYNVRIKLDTD